MAKKAVTPHATLVLLSVIAASLGDPVGALAQQTFPTRCNCTKCKPGDAYAACWTPVVKTVKVHGPKGVVPNHTTYELSLELSGTAASIYTCFGNTAAPLSVPPVFKLDAPFGSNIGGTNPMFWDMKPETEYDSWLTAGPVNQTALAKTLASISINWTAWPSKGLEVLDGALFMMDPTKSLDIPNPRLPVVAQLTVPSSDKWYASFNVQGKSECGDPPQDEDRAPVAITGLEDRLEGGRCVDWSALAIIFQGESDGPKDECNEALKSLCGVKPTSQPQSIRCKQCVAEHSLELKTATCDSTAVQKYCN